MRHHKQQGLTIIGKATQKRALAVSVKYMDEKRNFWPMISDALAMFAGAIFGAVALVVFKNESALAVFVLLVFGCLFLAYAAARKIVNCKVPFYRVSLMFLMWSAFTSGLIVPIALLRNETFSGSFQPTIIFGVILGVCAGVVFMRVKHLGRRDI